jgi:hypothetical protein
MGRIISYIMENKKCLKPPTRNCSEISKESVSTAVEAQQGQGTFESDKSWGP